MYSVLYEPGTTAKASHKLVSWLFVQLHSAYLVCWTTHGWTDTTASRQLATTLTDGDDNFWLAKRLIQDSARTTVCILRVVATTASGTERLASYCQVESLFYDRQLPRTARSDGRFKTRAKGSSTSSWLRLWLDCRDVSGMVWWPKHAQTHPFPAKTNDNAQRTTHYYSTLKFKNAIPETEPFTYPPTHYGP